MYRTKTKAIINIYSFEKGETDWVFASDMQEAKDFYLNYTQCGDLEGYTIKNVPKDEWSKHYILDLNEPEPDAEEDYWEEDYHNGYKIEETFEEYAKRNTIKDFICSTAY